MRLSTPVFGRALGVVVLAGAILAALWIANYKELDTVNARGARVVRSLAPHVTPSWALPASIAVGLAIAAVALVVYLSASRRS